MQFVGNIAAVPGWLMERSAARPAKGVAGESTTTSAQRPPEPTLPMIDLRVRFATERLRSGIIAPAIQGRGGSRACLLAAIEVTRGYCVTTGDGRTNCAFELLWNVYNPICIPPWTTSEADQADLLHKISDAELKSEMQWRWRLDYRLALALRNGEIDRSDICQSGAVATDVMSESADEVRRPGAAAPGGVVQAASVDAHPPGACLIDHLSPLPQPPPQPPRLPGWHDARTSSPTPTEVIARIEQLAATIPSRSIPIPELLKLLHSDTRDIAENGPRPDKTPESRAFVVALGAAYANADVHSTTDLLLSCKGGIAAQQAVDPIGYAKQLWLDAWRHRDGETADAEIMIVDKVFFDPAPDPRRTRAVSRMTFKLRPIDKPRTEDYANQKTWNIPFKLGAPNVGDLSGEWAEARPACEVGAARGRCSKYVTEAWQDALVGVVFNDAGDIRHLIQLEADRVAEIHAALAVCAAFAIFADKHRETSSVAAIEEPPGEAST